MLLWAVLLALLAVAAGTDLMWQKIPNWVTYPGCLLGLALRGLLGGWPAAEDGIRGLVLCGGIMLLCFVMFQLGGGDLKLVAMMGAFLGWERGIEALLWTFVLGGVLGVAWLIWQIGVFRILTATFRQMSRIWNARGWVPLTAEERRPLQQQLFLAPAGLLAAVIVTWPDWQMWLSADTVSGNR